MLNNSKSNGLPPSPGGSSHDGSASERLSEPSTSPVSPATSAGVNRRVKSEPTCPSDPGSMDHDAEGGAGADQKGEASSIFTVHINPEVYQGNESSLKGDTGSNEMEASDQVRSDTSSPLPAVDMSPPLPEVEVKVKSEFNTLDLYRPFFDCNHKERIEIECGQNKASLYVDKLCQGSKGKCIIFKDILLTPNEFQSISGRETAKDWKRSIRHRGKSLKSLMSRGLLKAHPMMCECQNCKNQNASRGEKGDKKSTTSPSISTKSVTHHFDDMAVEHFPDYTFRNFKRARSSSPPDDIYDMEQRKIFQAANSPEPSNIETLRKSFVVEGVTSHRGTSPTETTPCASDINHNDTLPCSTSGIIQTSLPIKFKATKLPAKNRKQSTPKHLEKVPHIALTSIPSHQTYTPNKSTHASMRARYQQSSQSLTITPRPLSSGEPGPTTKRAKSLLTPSTKSPGIGMRMIELTRPQSSTDKAGTPNSLSNGDADHSNSFRQSATSTSDGVFLSSDLSSWSVEDVVEFVQGLKGCEEYSQVFRDQAIDGEILPILTEEHLLSHMGLKLGPALKIKLHIAKRLGYIVDHEMQ